MGDDQHDACAGRAGALAAASRRLRPPLSAARSRGPRRRCRRYLTYMTLLIATGNYSYTILVADRRLVVNGVVSDEEANKAATFSCRDARLALAFTGVAKAGNFHTSTWLLDAVARSAPDDYLAGATLDRFSGVATRAFATLRVPPSKKRTTFIAAGYLYEGDVPRPVFAWVSNYERFPGPDLPHAGDFEARFGSLGEGGLDQPAYAFATGFTHSDLDPQLLALGELATTAPPPQAVVDKAVDVVRTFARRPVARDMVGEQCSSVILWSDPSQPARVDYHSAYPTGAIYFPDHVEAQGGDFGVQVMTGVELHLTNERGEPVVTTVPRVRRSAPCPCGSGKKYKRCHGRAWLDSPEGARPIAG